MATSPAASDASHESENDDQNPNNKSLSAKDKECQYCHQKFTSSSLGRHLDQFISKKKPDGLHDVEEIKRLRAGITRRTARGAKRGDTQDLQESQLNSPSQPQSGQSTTTFVDTLKTQQGGTGDIRFNRMGWQSTGVITDPQPPTSHDTANISPLAATNSNTAAGTKRSFSTYVTDLPTASANETARALELSLREVLDAVNVAARRAAPLPRPFPVEITSLSFPALCLNLLPAPPTLYQTSPYSTNATIPLRPPGFEQLDFLRSKIRTTLDQWKWDALAHLQRSSLQNSINFSDEAERLTTTTQARIDEAMLHLDNVFQLFSSHPTEQQYHLWSIELLRAYQTEQNKLKDANSTIARITQEAAQLQRQVDHLSRCQWPREMALWPPERNTFTDAVQKELQSQKYTSYSSLDSVNAYGTSIKPGVTATSAEDLWDFEKLVDKWKRHVREDRARRALGTNSMLPPPAGDAVIEPSRTGTPPASMRKALSESTTSGSIGVRPGSAANSPRLRNGFNPPITAMGGTENPLKHANHSSTAINPNTHRTFAATEIQPAHVFIEPRQNPFPKRLHSETETSLVPPDLISEETVPPAMQRSGIYTADIASSPRLTAAKIQTPALADMKIPQKHASIYRILGDARDAMRRFKEETILASEDGDDEMDEYEKEDHERSTTADKFGGGGSWRSSNYHMRL